ncbi:MAG: electron transport complex subunit RsxE [Deltaproteobacteria bacterium]
MKNKLAILFNGIIKENPTFVMILGMCPTLAVTTTGTNGLGMGLATTFVLIMSNLVIALIKNLIPDKVRIPAFIVVIASFVTIIDMVLEAFVPGLYVQLGIFIPLIVVNCIILGRAEAFASKHNVLDSLIDGIGMGLGFTFALTILGSVREVLGNGTLFNISLFGDNANTILVFILPPGAFIALAYLSALYNKFILKK